MLLGKIKIGGVVFVGTRIGQWVNRASHRILDRVVERDEGYNDQPRLLARAPIRNMLRGQFAPGHKCPKKSLQVMVINMGNRGGGRGAGDNNGWKDLVRDG
nr:hypothetical protein [Tanacetum cinerariifolium]